MDNNPAGEEDKKRQNLEKLDALTKQLEVKKELLQALDKKLENEDEQIRAMKEELKQADQLLESSTKKLAVTEVRWAAAEET